MSRSLGAWFLLVAVAGCTSAPSRVTAPPINPNAGKDAVAKLDKNGDAAIDEAEAKTGAPGLFEAGAKARFDTNSDGKISAEEIDARIDKWEESKVGLTSYGVIIHVDGKPIDGATVKLVPEDWLGTELKAGTGVTDSTGRVNVSIAKEDLKPDEQRDNLQGMRLGVYRVEVTHPTIKLPAKLNTASEYGVEIAHDDYDAGRIPLEMTTR